MATDSPFGHDLRCRTPTVMAMIGQSPGSRMPRGALSLLSGIFVGTVAVWTAPTAIATPSEEPTPGPTTHLTGGDVPNPIIRYDITGTGIAGHITYQDVNGQGHAANVPLPWSTQLTGRMGNRGHTNAYSVSATGLGPGSISCTLSVNGQVVSQYTATGNPARVVCANH